MYSVEASPPPGQSYHQYVQSPNWIVPLLIISMPGVDGAAGVAQECIYRLSHDASKTPISSTRPQSFSPSRTTKFLRAPPQVQHIFNIPYNISIQFGRPFDRATRQDVFLLVISSKPSPGLAVGLVGTFFFFLSLFIFTIQLLNGIMS